MKDREVEEDDYVEAEPFVRLLDFVLVDPRCPLS